jgi:hypothetical protein
MILLDADNDPSVIGEDTWELFEVIEESFGVKLGNYFELAGITVGRLAERIDMRTAYPPFDGCLSSAVFYQLRRAFKSVGDVPRTAVRPGTPLRTILPWRSRRADWNTLEMQLGLTLPQLTFPSWLTLLCLVSPAACLISDRLFLGAWFSWFEVALGSFALTVPVFAACIPLARSFPTNCDTIADLAKLVLARNFVVFATKFGSPSAKDVLSSLRLLVATETGRGLDEISSETRIPTDLNIY